MEDKTEKIKELFLQLDHKSEFINQLVGKVNRSEKTMRKWWFSNYGLWSVPKKLQDQVIKELKNTLKKQ